VREGKLQYTKTASICHIFIINYLRKKYVVKVTKRGVRNIKILLNVKNDYLNIRNILTKYANLPELYFIEPILINNAYRLLLVEEYAGLDIRSIARTSRDFQAINKYINECLRIINTVPVDIPVDTNPANFTHKSKKIYFVDLLPTQPRKYRNSRDFLEYVKVFPTIGKDFDYLNKFTSYHKTKLRIKRFYKYLTLPNGRIVNKDGNVIKSTSTSEPL